MVKAIKVKVLFIKSQCVYSVFQCVYKIFKISTVILPFIFAFYSSFALKVLEN